MASLDGCIHTMVKALKAGNIRSLRIPKGMLRRKFLTPALQSHLFNAFSPSAPSGIKTKYSVWWGIGMVGGVERVCGA